MDSQQQIGDFLAHYEDEHLIEKLVITNIEEYGSQEQNIICLSSNLLISSQLLNFIIFNQQMVQTRRNSPKTKYASSCQCNETEIWKQKVLPLLKNHMLKINTYRSYIAVYHQAVVCNLLEVIMFHRTAVDSADEFLKELIDCCYRKLVHLIKFPHTKKVPKKTVEDVLKKTRIEEYQEQIDDIKFKICMMCIYIIRFISDHVKHLPVSVVHHLLEINDILCEREKYENSKWQIVEKSEYSKIVKLEANVWITIYNLFMNPECRKKYELNEFRKSNLLRLRKYMNEILLDQVPNLFHMLRTLEELSIMNVQSVPKSNPFIVQQIPEIRENIIKGKNQNDIAEKQKNEYFVNDKETAKQDMQRLADLYGQNIIDGLMEGFKCELCKKEATKRCSQCKTVWYCTRECQVVHWKDHKVSCKKIVEENKEKELRQKEIINDLGKENVPADNLLNNTNEKQVLVTEIETKTQFKQNDSQQEMQLQQQQNQNLDELD
ncbi:hypothetical protein ABPG74_002768 [Tetrahymena malaccensis]